MKIEKYVVGMIGTNCYLVINEETKDTVMVDPGAYPAKLKNAVKEQGLKLKAILLTHAHFDHIMGLSDVMEDIKVPVKQSVFWLYARRISVRGCGSGQRRTAASNCRLSVPCDPYTGAYTGRMLLLYGTGRCSF